MHKYVNTPMRICYYQVFQHHMCVYIINVGGGRSIRVMGGYGGGYHQHNHNHHQAAGAGGMGTTAFPSATAFPHYAIHQGIPFPATNLYG